MNALVNIGEAKTRLSQLVAAAIRGEEVILAKAGEPQVRLVPVESALAAERERIRAKRQAAIGMYAHLFDGYSLEPRSFKMTEEEIEENYRRKFGVIA